MLANAHSPQLGHQQQAKWQFYQSPIEPMNFIRFYLQKYGWVFTHMKMSDPPPPPAPAPSSFITKKSHPSLDAGRFPASVTLPHSIYSSASQDCSTTGGITHSWQGDPGRRGWDLRWECVRWPSHPSFCDGMSASPVLVASNGGVNS